MGGAGPGERGVSLHREQLMGGAGPGERGVSLHREQLMGGAGPGEREYHCTGSDTYLIGTIIYFLYKILQSLLR